MAACLWQLPEPADPHLSFPSRSKIDRQSRCPAVNEHSVDLNPSATDHLPFFVTAPGQTDVLFNVMIVFLIIFVFAVGLLYLRLHALPEHMAQGISKGQLQIVGVLTLLALFTHNHIFWVAALLLALVKFPDLASPLGSVARSLEKLSGREPPPAVPTSAPEVAVAPPKLAPVAEEEQAAPALRERRI